MANVDAIVVQETVIRVSGGVQSAREPNQRVEMAGPPRAGMKALRRKDVRSIHVTLSVGAAGPYASTRATLECGIALRGNTKRLTLWPKKVHIRLDGAAGVSSTSGQRRQDWSPIGNAAGASGVSERPVRFLGTTAPSRTEYR